MAFNACYLLIPSPLSTTLPGSDSEGRDESLFCDFHLGSLHLLRLTICSDLTEDSRDQGVQYLLCLSSPFSQNTASVFFTLVIRAASVDTCVSCGVFRRFMFGCLSLVQAIKGRAERSGNVLQLSCSNNLVPPHLQGCRALPRSTTLWLSDTVFMFKFWHFCQERQFKFIILCKKLGNDLRAMILEVILLNIP